VVSPQKKEQKVMFHPTALNRLTKLTFSLVACLTLAFALSGAAWAQSEANRYMTIGWYMAPENKAALEAKLKECGPAVSFAGIAISKKEDYDAWNNLSQDCKNAADAQESLDGRTRAWRGDKKKNQKPK
jgi:hypothetical protein